MNKLVIVILIVLAIAAGLFFWSRNPASDLGDDTERVTRNEDDETSEDDDSTNSFANLFKSGSSQTCTYTYTGEDGSELSGDVYVSGNRMRSNYRMMQDNQPVSGSMIQDGEVAYIWSSSMPEGIKMKFDMEQAIEDADDTPDTTAQNPIPVDPNVEMDFDCNRWTPDNAMFTPPSDITFRDVSALIENVPANLNNGNTCSVCESLQGDSKAACQQQLGCE